MSAHKERITFALMAPEAREVFLSGSFNDWSPASDALKQNRSGIWKKEKKLAPGTYEYKFIVDGVWVVDPNCPTTVTDAHGSINSLLEVKSGSTSAVRQEDYIEKIKGKLEKLQAELDKLEEKAARAKDASTAKYQKQIESLRAKGQEFEEKLEHLRQSGGKAWEELKEGVEGAWKSLSDAIKSAKSKLK